MSTEVVFTVPPVVVPLLSIVFWCLLALVALLLLFCLVFVRIFDAGETLCGHYST